MVFPPCPSAEEKSGAGGYGIRHQCGALGRQSGNQSARFCASEEALSYPRAAWASPSKRRHLHPVSRAADVLAVVENISLVEWIHIQVVNQTTGQKATQPFGGGRFLLPLSLRRRDATKLMSSPAPVMVRLNGIRFPSFISPKPAVARFGGLSRKREESQVGSRALGKKSSGNSERDREKQGRQLGAVSTAAALYGGTAKVIKIGLIDWTLALPSIRFGSDGDLRSSCSLTIDITFYGFS